MLSEPVAQTNLQLYNQMLAQGRSNEELALVKGAYDLAALLYSAHYQSDGKPFISHGVGVASILCHLRLPAEVVAFGLVHNVYGNGDFGDGRQRKSTPARRSRVRAAVGPDVEALALRFGDFRVNAKTIDHIEAELESYGDFERYLVMTELADHLEKCVDDGALYFGDAAWTIGNIVLLGDRMVMIAERLGQPRLATMLKEGFGALAGRPLAPRILRQEGQIGMAMKMPLSVRKRLYPGIVAYFRQAPWKRGRNRL